MGEKGNTHKKFDLQKRLVDYSDKIIHVNVKLSDTKADKHIIFQILKSGSLPAANYREAPNAESMSNYIYFVR